MKIATNNKIVHLQVEIESLANQTAMLQNQLMPLRNQIVNLESYVRLNMGDRKSLQELRELNRRYNSLRNQITKNCRRMDSLNIRINNEIQRVSCPRMRRYSHY